MRNGNLAFKTILILLVLILKFGVFWKNRREKKKVKMKYNIMSLNQTILILVMLYLDNAFLSYFIVDKNNFVFNMEMFRLIFIENICFRFLVPLYLIFDSKSKLPALWAENTERKLDFFMTSSKLWPRPVVTRFKEPQKAPILSQRKKKVTFGNDVVINICNIVNETRISLPDVEI